jgi:excinuclease UvrABC nuclease subunit
MVGGGWKRPSALARMVKELDGVGGKKALDIAKKFGTMDDLMAASVDDIMEVPGIGPTISEGIWKQLRGQN